MRPHAAPDRCTFCLGVHAMQGEWYCVQLEQMLAQALEKASAALAFRKYHLSLTATRSQDDIRF